MSPLSTDSQAVQGGGLRAEIRPAGQGRFLTAVPEQDAPPPAPVFELPPVGPSPHQLLQGSQQLAPTLRTLLGMISSPAVKQLLGNLTGIAQQAGAAEEPASSADARPSHWAAPDAQLDGAGPGRFGIPPREQGGPATLPPAAPSLQQLLQGAGNLAPMLSALIGTLASPTIKQLLGSPELQQLLGNPTVQQWLGSPAIKQLLGNPAVKQLFGNLTGMAQQPGAADAIAFSGDATPTGRGRFGASPPEPDARPPSPVFELPPADPGLQQLLQGAGKLLPILSALVGMLGSPAIRQLLGNLTGMAQQAGAANGIPLSALGALVGSGIYDATLNEPGQSTPEVSTNELRRILDQNSALVFDNRTALEYAIGHIPGALNVAPKPGVAMSLYVSDVAEIAQIAPSKQAPIIVYCNGPFCGKSRRLGDELVAAGFTNVRRYQLGTPVWRALVGPMAVEPAGVRYIAEGDRTAAFVDARSPAEFASGSLPSARNVPPSDVVRAKDDGRLPMDDFNTRVVVFGREGAQAHAMAQTLVGQGFNNVKFFDGAFSTLVSALR